MPRAHKGERGQSTAEFVLIVPFLLLFFFLILDFGWLLKNWIVVTNTAREATRCTVVDDCWVSGMTMSTDPTVRAQQLVDARLSAGITGNLSKSNTDKNNQGANTAVEYVDRDGNGYINAGDTIVVCVSSWNYFISPVVPFLSMIVTPIGGSVTGQLDPMSLKAREEMRLELMPKGSTPPPPKDGDCGTP